MEIYKATTSKSVSDRITNYSVLYCKCKDVLKLFFHFLCLIIVCVSWSKCKGVLKLFYPKCFVNNFLCLIIVCIG